MPETTVVAEEPKISEASDPAQLEPTEAKPDVVEETSAYEVMLLQMDFY